MAKDSETYWREREQSHIAQQIKDDKQMQKELAKRYQSAIDAIQSEINSNWSNFMGKEAVTFDEAKKSASEMDIKAFARKAKKYVKDKDFSKTANDELKLYNLTMRVNRLELLKSQVGLELVALGDDTEKYFADTLTKEGTAEAKRQAGILGDTLPKSHEDTIKSIVNGSFQSATVKNGTFSDTIWGNLSGLKSDLDKLLTRGITTGKNPRELARELKKTMGSSRYETERLMRTESARIQSEIQKDSYDRNNIEEYEFIAEPGACSICRPLDNGKPKKVIDMLTGKNASPMHPNCRCSTAPVVDREELENRIKEIENVFDPEKAEERINELFDKMLKLGETDFESDAEEEAALKLYDKYEAEYESLRSKKKEYDLKNGKEFTSKDGSPDSFFINQDSYKKWMGKLSSTDIQAIEGYTGPGYMDINRFLRGGEEEYTKELSKYDTPVDKLKTTIADLKKAIGNFEVEQPFMVERGIAAHYSEKEWSDLVEGETEKVFDNAFMSSTLKGKEILENFGDGDSTIMRIHLKKGDTIGAYVSENSSYSGEKEFLILPDVKFKVISKSIEKWRYGTKQVLDLEVSRDD